LATRSGKQLIAQATHANLITTDLAIYEACNGLWKLATLLKTIKLEDATRIASLLHELTAKNVIQTLCFTSIDLPNTLTIASDLKLTFYDASYIAAAQKTKATLVTEDQKLRKIAAGNSVTTMSFSQLQSELRK
jgi:predicted nucleic acid-binding protein